MIARARVRRALRALALALAVSAALAGFGICTAWALVVRGELVDLARFARPGDALVVVDRHGAPLRHARADGIDRRWAALAELPPDLIAAFLAAEDSHFYQHRGVDFRAAARSAARNVLPWTRRSGASTLTQQLVKLVYGRARGLREKLVEALRAATLERAMSKDDILEQYLNRVPFGDRIEGVARASEEYFGVAPRALTLSQAALLAGVPQAPSATEPRRHLARALARRATVLARMRDAGFIDAARYRAALEEPIVIRDAAAHPDEAPRFVDASLAEIRAGRGEHAGGVLTTSLDLPLQRRAEAVVAAAVDRFAVRGARNGAAIVLATATGEVLAYVGAARRGESAPGGQLDLLRARRQPGSTLKPFVYELLFERGGTAATVLDDVAVPMTGARGASFEARDYDGRERGPVRARAALAGSLNLAALDAARRVGPDAVIARLGRLGFGRLERSDRYGAAVVLGGADVTALELARAYATLARGGTSVPLAFAPDAVPDAAPVMQPDAARVAWDILSDPVARADAFGADLLELSASRPFALKTGTSAGWRDAWAAVATDAFTVVVWLGDPRGGPMTAVSGFEAAAPAAVSILAAAHARASTLALPALVRASSRSLESVAVCAWTGLRAGARCRHAVHEHFVPGTAPRERCEAHDASGAYALPARYRAWAERARPAGVDAGGVANASHGDVPVVTVPRDGARWLLDPARGRTVTTLRASVAGAERRDARWEVDGAPTDGARWVATPGRHSVVAVWRGRRSEPVELTVARAPR